MEEITVSRSAWLTLGILSSTLLVVFFSETMLLPAIPEIMQDLQVPYATAAWIFSGYMIVAAVMTPIAGKLSDIYGKKKVLLALLAIYIAGTAAGGFANNITFLLIVRVIQGVGLAAVPAAFSLLRDTFPPAKLATAVGVFGSAYSAGSVVGLLAGASIIHNFGWNSTFFFIAPAAAMVTAMIAKLVKENKQPPAEVVPKSQKLTIDVKGAIALSATTAAFLMALTLVQTGGSVEQIAAAFAASVISLSAFVAVEKRTRQPLLDFRLLKERTLMPSYLILIAVGITMFMAYPSIVQLVRSPRPLGFGGDAVEAANVQLPFMVMFLVFASVTPFIINRIGNKKPIIIGSVISLIGSIGLLAFHSTGFEVSANLAVIAAGLSLAITATWNIVVSSSPREFVGISTAVGALLLFIGMATGPAVAGVYMQNHEMIEGVAGTYPSLGSYNLVFATSALLSAMSLGFALMLRRKARKEVEA
ncbi:MAG TPA: MFS transporter [Nitrososphaera sp.]|nr:MFS transporter [Nitrososphaera sp.]